MDIDDQNLLEKQSSKEKREQDEPEDELDERFLLTPKNQENLLNEIIVEGELKEIGKIDKGFEEEVSDSLGELQNQQQLNIDIALQARKV